MSQVTVTSVPMKMWASESFSVRFTDLLCFGQRPPSSPEITTHLKEKCPRKSGMWKSWVKGACDSGIQNQIILALSFSRRTKTSRWELVVIKSKALNDLQTEGMNKRKTATDVSSTKLYGLNSSSTREAGNYRDVNTEWYRINMWSNVDRMSCTEAN